MLKLILLPLLYFSFLAHGQSTIMTIYNEGRFESQTGTIVDGYKEGKWTCTRYKKTSFSFYERDKLVKSIENKKTYRTKTPYTEIKYFNAFFPEKITQIDSTNEKILAIHKSVGQIHNRDGAHKFSLTRPYKDASVLRVTNKISFIRILSDINNEYKSQYNNDLIFYLPTLDSISLNEWNRIESFVLKWKNAIIRFPKGLEDFHHNGNHYHINWRQLNEPFFLGMVSFNIQKNGKNWLKYSFKEALPTSFKSFHLNGNVKLSCRFTNGFLDQSFELKNRKRGNKISCYFNQGLIERDFNYYNLNNQLVLKAPFKNGLLHGWVEGLYYDLEYGNGQRKKYIKKNDNGEIINWGMFNNRVVTEYNTIQSNINRVKVTTKAKDNLLQEIGCYTDNFSFSYLYYPSQDIISIGYSEGPNNKRNGFHLYTTKKGKIRDDVNITRNGIFSHKEEKEKAIREINKNYFNLSSINPKELVKRTFTNKGSLTQITYFYPNGAILLTEKRVNGKLHGERRFYNLKGQVMQSVSYKENIPHGRFTTYTTKGEVLKTGRYNNGEKIGIWTDKKGLDYVYENGKMIYFAYSTFTGKLRQEYFYPPEGKRYIKYDTLSGNIEAEYQYNPNDKLNGPCYYKITTKKKQTHGNYLNGYKHGKWQVFDPEGTLLSTTYYEYNNISKNPINAKNRNKTKVNNSPQFNTNKKELVREIKY